MHGLSGTDGARRIDWGLTSRDYAAFRRGYPEALFDRLAEAGVGLPGQQVLDLGTGTGLVALALARRGAVVTGVDIAAGQIEQARAEAREAGLEARFEVAPAEDTGMPAGAFDAVTAGQCFLYFDRERAIREIQRVLRPGGLLATCHLCWLPREDAIARASEALVLEHNPAWTAAGWSGEVPEVPAWAEGRFEVRARIVFDVPLPFTREEWRGRFRACRGVGATLTPEEVRRFDEAHAQLLERDAPPELTVLHRVDAHVIRVA